MTEDEDLAQCRRLVEGFARAVRDDVAPRDGDGHITVPQEVAVAAQVVLFHDSPALYVAMTQRDNEIRRLIRDVQAQLGKWTRGVVRALNGKKPRPAPTGPRKFPAGVLRNLPPEDL